MTAVSLLPDQPVEVGRVLDVGFKIFGRTLKPSYLLLFGGMLLGVVLLGLGAIGFVAGEAVGVTAISIMAIPAIVIYVWTYLAMIDLQARAARGVERPWQESMRYARSRLLPSLGVGLILVLAFIALSAVAFAPMAISRWIGIATIPLWLVAIAWLAVRAYLSMYCCVLEGLGPVESIRRSFDLTEGFFWRTTAIVAVNFILSMVVAAVAQILGLILMLVFGGLGAAVGSEVLAGVAIALVYLVQIPIQSAAIPVNNAISIATLNDYRLRREGSDLLSRMGAR
jgi:hypothetical protein